MLWMVPELSASKVEDTYSDAFLYNRYHTSMRNIANVDVTMIPKGAKVLTISSLHHLP
jgi:hypothetical protein